MIVEVCVNSAISAIEARTGGAGRVELCENLMHGGTTPGAGSVRYARQQLDIPLFVMIRPRGGDFLYCEAELEIMHHDILTAKKLGADGVVFGILNPDGTINRQQNQWLSDIARPMQVTFHRAFDMTADPIAAMDALIGIGIDRILTSGQQPNALAGAPLIRKLIEEAAGRIRIMPGGGIKEHNIREVMAATGASEYHVRLDKQEESRMQFRQSSVSMGDPDISEFQHTITDQERIRNLIKRSQCP